MRFPFKLANVREFDCVGFGENSLDQLISVAAYPAPGDKVQLVEQVQTAGGQVASAIVGLQRLGMRTAYAGRFGSDAEGALGLESLRGEGVNVEFAERVAGVRTRVAFIIIDVRSGERTILWDRDERLAYAEEDVPQGFASRGRVLHLDAHDTAACVRLAREARAAGTIVSADIDNVYEGLAELLPSIDILISSSEFPRKLTGIVDERAALVELKSRYGCAVTGMTLGERGALLYHEGVFLQTPAFAVPGGCCDTTGAGDAFHAGFLYAMLQGEEMEACLTTGCAVAALKCRTLGARAGLPVVHELSQLLTSEGQTS